MRVVVPQTEDDFRTYFELRYEILRRPWGQPFSSVKDDLEDTAMHAMILDEKGIVAGVCRMQFNNKDEAQLRFMAIRADLQGKGHGKLLLTYFEELASRHNKKRIVLQAREAAVGFYRRNGYMLKEQTQLLWGVIQHYRMEKVLLRDE